MEKTCCFTGPRLYKLPFSKGEDDPRCKILKEKIHQEILLAIQGGYEIFYSGMATGTDLFCAEAVLSLKKEYPMIQLFAALPFEGQANGWNKSEQQRYKEALEQADKAIVVQKAYSKDCFFLRNRYMVDQSSLVIAVYGGGGGGTAHTLKYAGKSGVRIRLIPVP